MHRDPDQGSKEIRLALMLVERFPNFPLQSWQLLMKGEAFRDLCEEYETCTTACERLAQPGGDEALQKEYSALRLRLEGELLWYMSQLGGHAGRN